MEKNSILIVDDAELNREILAEAFADKYEIIEAANGREALDILEGQAVSAVLLDLIMPVMNGVELLRELNSTGFVKRVPVFMITAAGAECDKMLMEAYGLGAVDIVPKPFIVNFLICRVENMIELFRHRRELEEMVEEQVRRLTAINTSMVESLAELIEFRDCESGEHVKRICKVTEILLRSVSELYPEYRIEEGEIHKIVTSAMLHDIGKISVPDNILNKPGRLTEAEFEIIKRHTVSGWEILEKFSGIVEEGVYDYCRDICRHHHERWDGTGYPDKLRGDEISIWAQVASVADVYDALTSHRVYKSAFSHEKAVGMIMNGECGCFNPKILEAFTQSLDKIKTASEGHK